MIYIASDHAGFELKNSLTSFLQSQGHELMDIGPKTFDSTDDYPDFIIPAAEKVAEDPNSVGIVLGGSGQGEAIAANKVKGIRAALYYGGPTEIITLSKEHNNANILSLGARFLTEDQAIEAVSTWLNAKFSNEERHHRRLDKIEKYESR